MATLIKKQKNKEVQTISKGIKTHLKQRFIIAVTLSLLLGLGWGLGIPATEGIDNLVVRTTFQILFIFLTAFQGLFIFIMHCVRVPDARKEWRHWFNKLTFHSEAAYTRSTLSRDGRAGFVYKEVPNKAGTLTTSVAGRDSSTLRKSFESSTFTKEAISTYETSTFRHTDSDFFSSILESETAFNEMPEQISMPIQQKSVSSVSDKPQSVEKDKELDTIFVNPAADLREESSLEEMSVDNRKEFVNPLVVPQDNALPGGVSKEDLSVDSGSNATLSVFPIEQTATKEISPAGKMPSGQSVSTQMDRMIFDVWYSTNPRTFSLHLSREEPRTKRFDITWQATTRL